MKNLIKIILFSSVIALSVFSCQKSENKQQATQSDQLELRSDDPCFTAPPASCQFGVFTNTITLAGFSDCDFVVSVPYYYCYGGQGVANYIFSDFNIVEYQCLYGGYEDSLAYHSANGTLAEFETRFNQLMWEAITNAFFSIINNVTYTATITYNTSSCARTCYSVVDVKEGEYSAIIKTKIGCGTGCCKIIRNYRKIDGVWKLQSIEDASDPASCFDDEENSCPFGTIYSTKCRQQCDDLLF